MSFSVVAGMWEECNWVQWPIDATPPSSLTVYARFPDLGPRSRRHFSDFSHLCCAVPVDRRRAGTASPPRLQLSSRRHQLVIWTSRAAAESRPALNWLNWIVWEIGDGRDDSEWRQRCQRRPTSSALLVNAVVKLFDWQTAPWQQTLPSSQSACCVLKDEAFVTDSFRPLLVSPSASDLHLLVVHLHVPICSADDHTGCKMEPFVQRSS